MSDSRRFLTPEHCEKIVANLDECLAFFEQQPRLLSGSELRVKSLLTVLREEVALRIKLTDDREETASRPPW